MAKKDEWKDYLYFAYKKAKHFVTKETSFVESIKIIEFEKNLDTNIEELKKCLKDQNKLKEKIQEMKGYLYFVPKSFGPNKEPRIRPKVAFPFEYQILWAAVILRIGEWFDTNSRMKNSFSMRNQSIRKELEWMVPWSFNGRIKRIAEKNSSDIYETSYIHYNDKRLYESHQMALKKFNSYETKVTKQILKYHSEAYKATLDIQEFFPTLAVNSIKSTLNKRLNQLNNIPQFKDIYFDTKEMKGILDTLFDFKIIYPKPNNIDKTLLEVLEDYYKKLKSLTSNSKENNDDNEFSIDQLVKLLDNTLPLDLIASSFLSNCVLNDCVDVKIQEKQKQDQDFYILRYTDDYVVLSHNQKKVFEIIKKIKKYLQDIGLKYSFEKTLPTNEQDIQEKLKMIVHHHNLDNDCSELVDHSLSKNEEEKLSDGNWPPSDLYKKKLKMIGIDPSPKKITKNCMINNGTLSKLSSTSDIKLQALTDRELEMYIKEMMFFMQTSVGVNDLKEETIKIFAAWRLNASYHEKAYRELVDWETVKEFLCLLENTIKEYPYKMGLYDVYILILFRIIEDNNTGYEQFKIFLKKIKNLLKIKEENDENENNIQSIYFPSIRIRILNLISNQWYRFNEEKRKELRKILKDAFLDWYADPGIYWDELYTLYKNLFILRIRLPLNKVEYKEEDKKSVPPYLLTISNIYNYYFFITKNSNEELASTENFYLAVELFKKGLYWNRHNQSFYFNELDQLIYKKLRSIKSNKEGTGETKNNIGIIDWLAFLKIDLEKITVDDWKHISKLKGKDKGDSYYEIYDFLQLNIQRYFENPKKYSSIFKWIIEKKEKNSNDEDNSEFKDYVIERFRSYAKIRSYFSLSDDRLPILQLEIDSNDDIPLADWIFYCQTLPYHLETIPMKQNVLHPLTEYEFVDLLQKILKAENKNQSKNQGKNFKDCITHAGLFEVEISPEQWIDFRNGKEVELTFNPKNKDSKDQKNEGSQQDQENRYFTECVKLLFSMLTNRPWHTHVKKTFSMYKWNDLQSYFEMTYYPSNAVASLFVNYLNIHQYFYYKTYNMPLEELPYREVYTRLKINNSIDNWIENYLNFQESHSEVYRKANRKVELLEIDIDQLRS